jgi:hypothetical protein
MKLLRCGWLSHSTNSVHMWQFQESKANKNSYLHRDAEGLDAAARRRGVERFDDGRTSGAIRWWPDEQSDSTVAWLSGASGRWPVERSESTAAGEAGAGGGPRSGSRRRLGRGGYRSGVGNDREGTAAEIIRGHAEKRFGPTWKKLGNHLFCQF